jgi:hypothetical protein
VNGQRLTLGRAVEVRPGMKVTLGDKRYRLERNEIAHA